ncbi:MAG: hypothetical protein IJ956_00470, partial [Akkermansia sp.]|nr:hypothetical protein [Akkermansia sp.]
DHSVRQHHLKAEKALTSYRKDVVFKHLFSKKCLFLPITEPKYPSRCTEMMLHRRQNGIFQGVFTRKTLTTIML